MKTKITKNMALAIEVGLAEMENSGIWEEDLSKKEIKKVNKGIKELEILLEEIKLRKRDKKNGKEISDNQEDI